MPRRHRVFHTTPGKPAGMSRRTCSQSAMRVATQLQSSHAPCSCARDPHRRPGGRDHLDGLAALRAGAETKQKTAQGTLISLLVLSLPSAPVLEPQGGKTPACRRPHARLFLLLAFTITGPHLLCSSWSGTPRGREEAQVTSHQRGSRHRRRAINPTRHAQGCGVRQEGRCPTTSSKMAERRSPRFGRP